MRNALIVVIELALTLILVNCAFGQDNIKVPDSASRTWTSNDGKFRITARLMEIEDEKVILLRDDGKNVSVDISRLSEVDQQFLAEEKNRVGERHDSLTAESPKPSASTPRSPIQPKAPKKFGRYSAPLQPVSLRSDLPVDLMSEIWQPSNRRPIKDFRVDAHYFHARMTAASSNADDRIFGMSFLDPFANRTGGGSHAAWVTLIDLEKGSLIGEFPLPTAKSVLGGIHPDGTECVINESSGNEKSTLRFFRIEANGLAETDAVLAEDGGFFKRLDGIHYLADGNLLVVFSDRMVVFRRDPWSIRFFFEKTGRDWKLAPDRRHALVRGPRGWFEIDLIDGVCTGESSSEGSAGSTSRAISRKSGSKAVLDREIMTVYSADGAELDSFFVPVNSPGGILTWIDDRFLSVHTQRKVIYIDTENRVALATQVQAWSAFEENGWIVIKDVHRGNSFYAVRQAQAATLSTTDLEAYAAKLPESGDDLLIFKPGVEIRLELSFAGRPEIEESARRALEDVLARRGIRVAEQSPWLLQGGSTIARGDVAYVPFGITPPPENSIRNSRLNRDKDLKDDVQVVAVAETIDMLQLFHNNELVWSSTSRFGPDHTLLLKEGETAQQAADRESKRKSNFWESLTLPKHVAMHPHGLPWFVVK